MKQEFGKVEIKLNHKIQIFKIIYLLNLYYLYNNNIVMSNRGQETLSTIYINYLEMSKRISNLFDLLNNFDKEDNNVFEYFNVFFNELKLIQTVVDMMNEAVKPME